MNPIGQVDFVRHALLRLVGGKHRAGGTGRAVGFLTMSHQPTKKDLSQNQRFFCPVTALPGFRAERSCIAAAKFFFGGGSNKLNRAQPAIVEQRFSGVRSAPARVLLFFDQRLHVGDRFGEVLHELSHDFAARLHAVDQADALADEVVH